MQKFVFYNGIYLLVIEEVFVFLYPNTLSMSMNKLMLYVMHGLAGHGQNKPEQCLGYFIINFKQKAQTTLNM